MGCDVVLIGVQTTSSYDLVKTRTVELERIHETSVLLRQLRQFVHAKAQLAHYVQVDQKTVAEQGACIYVLVVAGL
jgi:hypothetical protein